MANNPLAGTGGRPIVGVPSPTHTFVGRIVIELFEGTQPAADANTQITVDANELVLIVSPGLGSNTTKAGLLKRIAAAFPVRAAKEIQLEDRRRKVAEEKGGIYE